MRAQHEVSDRPADALFISEPTPHSVNLLSVLIMLLGWIPKYPNPLACEATTNNQPCLNIPQHNATSTLHEQMQHRFHQIPIHPMALEATLRALLSR